MEIDVTVPDANRTTERACWWISGIDAETIGQIGLRNKIRTVLSLLREVDNITIDIMITIKNKPN